MRSHLQEMHELHILVKEEPSKTEMLSCPVCLDKCKGKLALESHLRATHSTFKCSECNYSYPERTGVERHRSRVHDPARSHVCTETHCGYRFKSKLALKIHTSTVHRKRDSKDPEPKPLECELCKFKTMSRDSMRSHGVSILFSILKLNIL